MSPGPGSVIPEHRSHYDKRKIGTVEKIVAPFVLAVLLLRRRLRRLLCKHVYEPDCVNRIKWCRRCGKRREIRF